VLWQLRSLTYNPFRGFSTTSFHEGCKSSLKEVIAYLRCSNIKTAYSYFCPAGSKFHCRRISSICSVAIVLSL
jgi:hypothetical protein